MAAVFAVDHMKATAVVPGNHDAAYVINPQHRPSGALWWGLWVIHGVQLHPAPFGVNPPHFCNHFPASQGEVDSIGSLALAERYGVNVSRVTRSGFKFTGRLDLRIKFADKLMVVGTAEGIEAAAKELGNSLTALDIPEILPAFLGIFLGVIVGSIPIAIPGMPTPLKLGLAGGPLIVAIVLSRKRKIGPLNFFMASSANLMLREFGLTLFLSCVGLNAGIKFFDVLLNGDGLYYMALAAFITFIPIATVAVIGHLVFKVNYLVLCGVLAGATTDPPALAFANGQADKRFKFAVPLHSPYAKVSKLALVTKTRVCGKD